MRPVIRWFETDPDRQDRFGIALCLILGVIVQFAGTTLNSSPYELPAWVGIGPLVVACVADLWRRRAPFPALIVSILATAASIAAGTNLVVVVIAVDLLYAAVLYGSPRISQLTLRLAVICTVAIAAFAALFVHNWRIAFFATLQTGLVLISAVSIAFTMRRQRDLAAAEAERAEQAERMARM
ncbi:MAG TPA: hypothetical protein VHC49_16600, partial [Mycobacteriales bacterium]|nr:hypothetical protein [Mycobacteriales bacterium]